MKDGYKVTQHRSFRERIDAAELVSSSMDLEKTKLFIDTMDNNTNELYAALPERLYILWEETVAYIGGVGPMYYSLEEVEMWLETFQRSQASPLKFRNLNSRIQ